MWIGASPKDSAGQAHFQAGIRRVRRGTSPHGEPHNCTLTEVDGYATTARGAIQKS